MTLPRVVIIGGGFAGLQAAKELRKAPVEVTLIDRHNHHLFQPLLYQVATAGLAPAEIAVPIRSVLRKQGNTHVLLGEVTSADLERREVKLADGRAIPYDYLLVAAGAVPNYYGHDEWAPHAVSLKDLRHALHIRERVLMAFEAAEQEDDAKRRKALLTFVVIGGGPTGVEMAGAIAELSHRAMAKDFRRIGPQDVQVILLEMANRVLTPFHEKLSEDAKKMLEELRVDVRLGAKVLDVREDGVETDQGFLPASTVCWATGVKPEPLASRLGVPLDRRGAILVEQDCSIAGHPQVFALGDIASFVPEGSDRPLPGLAPVALQQARFVGRLIRAELAGKARTRFSYRDKGIMATIGRSRAVAQSGPLRMRGFIAWLAWLFVHILYLTGFRNRVMVVFNWVWSYLTFKRGARLLVDAYDAADVERVAPPQLVHAYVRKGSAAPVNGVEQSASPDDKIAGRRVDGRTSLGLSR